ncbi:MAG: hypothetical protein AAFV53_33045 [Myxococcota bacterium]
MTRIKSLLRHSWRFTFSEGRNRLEFAFQQDWVSLLVNRGLSIVVIGLLALILALSGAWLSSVPDLQGFLFMAAGLLSAACLIFIGREVIRQRRCVLRLTDTVLEFPVGLARRTTRLPLAALTHVQHVSGLIARLRFRVGDRDFSFVLPSMRPQEANAIAAVVLDYARKARDGMVGSEQIGAQASAV